MRDVIDILQGIQRVKAPEYLFGKISQRIQQEKPMQISLVWVRAAAAALILLLSVEIYTVSQSVPKKKNITQLVPMSNNSFYNE
jgi:hypothetical protein